MREIIFRGKRVGTDEWIEGFYCRFGWIGQEKDYIIPSYASACTPFEVVSATVGQYTGLDDKNGVKIFEGDNVNFLADDIPPELVEKFPTSGTVRWSELFSAFHYSGCAAIHSYDQFEITGNIYDGEAHNAD